MSCAGVQWGSLLWCQPALTTVVILPAQTTVMGSSFSQASWLRVGPSSFATAPLQFVSDSRVWLLDDGTDGREPGDFLAPARNTTAPGPGEGKHLNREQWDAWKRYMFHVSRVTRARLAAAEAVEAEKAAEAAASNKNG